MPARYSDWIELSDKELKTKKSPSLEDCQSCRQKCCGYVQMPWDEPTDEEDIQELRWMVAHKGVAVNIEDDEWSLEFNTPCDKLGKDGLCTVYEKRPQICQEYAADMIKDGLCAGFADIHEDYEQYFETLEEFDAYIPELRKKMAEEEAYRKNFLNRVKWLFTDIGEAFKDFFVPS